MTMLQLGTLSRGFDCLNWLIDEVTVTILLIFLHSYIWFVLICPALQKLFGFAWAQRNRILIYANFNCAMSMHFKYGIGESSTRFSPARTQTCLLNTT